VAHTEFSFDIDEICERPAAQLCKKKTSENFFSRQTDASADATSAP
jgi:hypothetical protein